MKKSYNPNDIHQKEGQEQSRKLHRSITEHAKRLDDARGCARNVEDLFTPNLQIQRKKFRDYCERLIFSDPILFGRKVEELLWRKGYYDVISTAKKLKKQKYTEKDIANIQAHINCGIGYYHHFISKLQNEFHLNLIGIVDFAISFDIDDLKLSRKNVNDKVTEWANFSVHQCLIYLGDLSRYKLEIYPNWDSSLAIRYYSQALCFKPEYGMPHNQMGTLASNQNNSLDAVYHYMRCLACKFTFEGTENNLRRLFEKNSQVLEQFSNENINSDCIVQLDKTDYIKRFVSKFLLLADIWYFNKNVPHISNLCRQTFFDLEECLKYLKSQPSESGDTQTDLESLETESLSSISNFNTECLFKIAVICLLCYSKLFKLQSDQISTITAFIITFYLQLIQNVTYHIQESVLNFPLPNIETDKQINGLLKSNKKGKKNKLRRRRKKLESSDESDVSDDEKANALDSESEDSCDLEDDPLVVSSSDEETEQEKKSNTSADSVKVDKQNKIDKKKEPIVNGENEDCKSSEEIVEKSKRMNMNDMLEIISEEGLLQTIKVLSDWIESDIDIIKSCAKNTKPLFKQLTQLLNLINIDLDNSKLVGIKMDLQCIITDHKKIDLTEDVILRDFDIFTKQQKNIKWNYFDTKTVSTKEECLIRIIKLISFGKFITTFEETGVNFNDKDKLFICSLDIKDTTETTLIQDMENGGEQGNKIFDSHGQLTKMKHMGQLWLAAEVRDLENRVNGKTSLSPYLVLDADALIKYNFMVKHLVNSRKFIVLIPSAVVSALDDLKREKLEARDAIRWLESQFHQGNRFFRAQRPHERAPIPLIKYPKKKDKEAFIYIQIIECCHYLTQQQKGASNLVTLLIGNQNALSNTENREMSYIGLAKTAGVNLELITQFYAKWKKTSKGKR